MARSMTGYGAGSARLAGGTLSVEVRSVNHRHIDLRLDLPKELASIAYEIEPGLRARLARGRYDVTARLDGAATPPLLDRARARAAYQELAALRDELAPGTALSVAALVNLPELFRATPEWTRDDLVKSFEDAAEEALRGLAAMRGEEGRHVTDDVRARLAEARMQRARIAEEVPLTVERERRRLSERVARLVEPGASVEPGRLELEVVLFADRADVSEELARLASHFEQAERLLAEDGAVGKKLDFLLQEMVREANTIGSKSQSAPIAHAVVELKTAIERMREQAQNLE
ncbi:MAG: YicC family protein [Deltaproteobacteria bacterium]|nr:YicC family protein [Deltaproteobacteria bacterium]